MLPRIGTAAGRALLAQSHRRVGLGPTVSLLYRHHPRAQVRCSSVATAIPALEDRTVPSVSTHVADTGQPVEEPVEALDLEDDATGSPQTSITLRPYQEAAISACLKALEEGTTRMGVSSPTGSGKTTMFMKLIPHIVERDAGDGTGRERKKTLILVNAVELALQAEKAAHRLLGEDWTVEVEQGKREASGAADV